MLQFKYMLKNAWVSLLFCAALWFNLIPPPLNPPKSDTPELAMHNLCATVALHTSNGFSGTGVAIFSAISNIDSKTHAFILTEYHVVKQAPKAKVTVDHYFYFNNQHILAINSVVGDVIESDPLHDLALIEVQESFEEKVILASSEEAGGIRINTPVYKIGAALGFDPIMTEGRLVNYCTPQRAYIDLHQLTTPVIYGDSGGGCYISSDGHLFGLLHSIALAPGQIENIPITHICYATPLYQIIEFLKFHHAGFLVGGKGAMDDYLQHKKELKEKTLPAEKRFAWPNKK